MLFAKDDAWINVTAARQTNVSTAGPTEVSTARPTEVSTAGLTDVSMARLNDVSTSGQTDVPTPEQTDVSMARKMRRNKKSSKGGVENRSQSLQGEEFPVARRRVVTSERKLRNRSSGAYFTESLDVLEHQGDFPDGSCEGLSPESTVKKRLKMFEHKPVMGLVCTLHVRIHTYVCAYMFTYTYVHTYEVTGAEGLPGTDVTPLHDVPLLTLCLFCA